MNLESEIRNLSVLEQHFTDGSWKITKIFVRGELHEIIVKCREGTPG
jgi:hypothetical protein